MVVVESVTYLGVKQWRMQDSTKGGARRDWNPIERKMSLYYLL